MKPREEVLAALRLREDRRDPFADMPWGASPCIDGRELNRLSDFVPPDEWPLLGVTLREGVDPSQLEPNKPWAREAMIEQLRTDVAFGFEKALGRRGISSELMWTVVKMWLWILDCPIADGLDYPMYGLPLFRATALEFGFPNPIGDDSGTESKFEEAP
jgi:hypothetical protein